MSLMLAVPMLAQYGPRTNYPSRRPMPTPSRLSATSPRPYHHSLTNSYYGLRVGLAMSSVSSDDSYLDGSGLSSGVTMGFVAGFQMVPASPLFFETGLSYTEKGGRGHYGGSKFTYDLNYLEVPLLLKYDYRTYRDFSVQPFIGGYLALGVGGQVKDFGQHHAISSFDDDFFKRFDGGLRMGCGVEFSHLYAELAYDLGLSNICQDTFNSSRNGCLTLSCGVNF